MIRNCFYISTAVLVLLHAVHAEAMPLQVEDTKAEGAQGEEARVAEARATEALAERTGCLKCHSLSEHKIGPSFSAIATRYQDGPSPNELQLMMLPSAAELPEGKKSQVIIARIGDQFHIRIFDAQGQKIVDKGESELLAGPELDELKRQLNTSRTFGANPASASERLALITRAAMLAGQDSIRETLSKKIKFGGKGNWAEISKGAPMPPHSARLTDQEIDRILRWLLRVTVLRVMKTGLGSGTVTSEPAGFNCGDDCLKVGRAGETLTLTATPDPGFTFLGWEGDATGITQNVTVSMNANRSVRARFGLMAPLPELNDFTPQGIQNYLVANPTVTNSAMFVSGLPQDFKQNWILMTRSESLQTGTAEFPRVLLPSADATAVFTLGLTTHASYPGSHPNAIEYMQWDPTDRNFRFHEIVVDDIPAMPPFPLRTRGVSVDDAKCSKCHSTRNVLNRSSFPGTTGVSPGLLKAKNKPNWDTYDSWGGMMPFNRDRIYQGSLEAAAFRKLLNVSTWNSNPPVRAIIEQLQLQPEGVIPPIPAKDVITRTIGGTYDGHINFAFDAAPPILTEPAPVGDSAAASSNYLFNNTAGGSATTVTRGGEFVTLHHSLAPTSDEGRAVDLFDRLGGADSTFNALRIADELIDHRYATGSIEIDVRPIALAITTGKLIRSGNTVVSNVPGTTLSVDLNFFSVRHGTTTIDQLATNTGDRAKSLPRRKADIQKLNLDRTGDVYLSDAPGGEALGLIQQYGLATSQGIDTSLGRIRQEVFRRPLGGLAADQTIMGRIYVDREQYVVNTDLLTLYRWFLEPLGVSVDKWSMGVRGRSRTYTFADVFGSYTNVLAGELTTSLHNDPRATGLPNPFTDAQLIDAVNLTLSSAKLPPASGDGAIPRFTDIQRIFNKSCIECHGGLDYPPYVNYKPGVPDFVLDFSEDENPPAIPSISPRLARSNNRASTFAATILSRISATSEDCPFGLMPCGGPKLSQVDIETFRRWRDGGAMFTVGDPHIQTIDGTNYDFQADGEFVLLRGENLEVQVRQTAVNTGIPLGPNAHSGLTSCVSINTAVAMRIGSRRVTYQPDLNGKPNPKGLELRIDGKLVTMNDNGISLGPDGRIMPTIAPGGIQVESIGGTTMVITPGFWDHYQVWYLNIDGRRIRETEGLMGLIVPGNWLPAMPDGSLLGPRPEGLQERYDVLYKKFARAWRVTDVTSLFDYAPGTSTATFTLEDWPGGLSPNECKPPERPIPLPGKPPLKPVSREEAVKICDGIKDDVLRALAVQDVMVTGDPTFAKTHALSDRIRGNAFPEEPVLEFPADNQKDVDPFVTFVWNATKDADGDSISYRQYVWQVGQVADDNQAVPVGQANAKTMARAVSNLKPGQSYYWKVIAEDGRGGISESVIRRFVVRGDKTQ